VSWQVDTAANGVYFMMVGTSLPINTYIAFGPSPSSSGMMASKCSCSNFILLLISLFLETTLSLPSQARIPQLGGTTALLQCFTIISWLPSRFVLLALPPVECAKTQPTVDPLA
jgi:hypothetical protein